MSCSEYALAYARKGWATFPLYGIRNDTNCACMRPCDRPGKHPISLHGVKDATTNDQHWPSGCNIGLATGGSSGFVVIDVDGTRGKRSLYSLFAEHSRFPDTPVSITGNGTHILFKSPGPLGCRVGFVPGLDLRADSGYIVAPPSLHVSGHRYVWHKRGHPGTVPLADMPAWLLEILRPVERPVSPVPTNDHRSPVDRCRAYLARAEPAIEGQGGDCRTLRTAMLGGDFGLTDAEFWPLLCEWNQRCVPPWDELGLRRKLENANRYRSRACGCKLG